MDKDVLRTMLKKVAKGETSPDEALEKLASLPYCDGHESKIDSHRSVRQGFPEVIFGQGKTAAQILDISKRILSHGSSALATRVSADQAAFVLDKLPGGKYDPLSKTLVYTKGKIKKKGKGKILVITAGTSDIPVAEEAAVTAEVMGNRVERLFDVGVAGMHRLINRMETLREARVIIVVAGMEGALASVVAGMVAAPVVAVPTSIGYGASFGGVAALLSMLNSCASNVSVVNIDNGFGAAVFATTVNRL